MKEPIRAQGDPRNLEYVIPEPLRHGATVSATFSDQRGEVEPVAFARAFGSKATRVRLRFPANTPPGSYRGTIHIGGAEHPAVVEISGEPRIRISPGDVHISGASGQRSTLEFSVVNEGNVACEIAPTYGIGLFAQGGVEDALGAAYRKSEHGGQERVAILADKLAEAHGGLARIQIESGAGAIAPDEIRTLRANLRLPDNLRKGRTYTGTLEIQDAQCDIRVDVSDRAMEVEQ